MALVEEPLAVPFARESPERNCQQQMLPDILPTTAGVLDRLRRSRTFTLSLFTLVVVLLFSDQNLMAPNLSAIAQEFGLSDEEKDRRLGGDMAIAFFGFGAPASLVVGWLTDLFDRRKLFVAIVLLGELGAVATVFSTTFSQMFWTRAVTGVAIGGGVPLVFSIMGDLVESSRRTEASGAIGIAIGIGQGMGQVVAGFTGSCTSLAWRLPFLIVALPCLVLVALVLVATRDPPRGRLEQGLQEHFQAGGEYTGRPNLEGLKLLANSRTVTLVMLQGIPGCIPWGVIAVFLNDFLHQQRGLSVERATVVVALFGVGSFVGQVVGAVVGQQAYNRSSALQPLLMGTTTLGGIIPSIMLIRYTGGNLGMYMLYALTGGVLTAVTGPNIKSVLMNVTLPSTRGTSFGIFNLFDDLGRGLGPALVSLLVARRGRESAFTISMLAWLFCGFFHLAMTFTVEKDETKIQAHLAEYACATGGSIATKGGDPLRSPHGMPMSSVKSGGRYAVVPTADASASSPVAMSADSASSVENSSPASRSVLPERPSTREDGDANLSRKAEDVHGGIAAAGAATICESDSFVEGNARFDRGKDGISPDKGEGPGRNVLVRRGERSAGYAR